MIWIILGIVAVIFLAIFWRSRNAVWGGFTLGVIVGAIISVISAINGNHFHWSTIMKSAIVACLIGVAVELFYILSKKRT